MDPKRFDALSRLIAAHGSRRRLLGGMLAGAFGLRATRETAAATCRPSGSICREDANCCAGLCLKDALRRRRCTCPPGTKVCGNECISVSGCCTTEECVDIDIHYFCFNHSCVDGCFIAGTRVAMADGTTRPIEEIAVGDMVLGQHGVNRVEAIEYPLLGARMLFALNGGRYFVTAEHPFLTEEGWKSIDPAGTGVTNPTLPAGRLAAGDRLLTYAAVAAPVAAGGSMSVAELDVQLDAVPLRGLMGRTADPSTLLFNLRLDGDHTYFADDWLVHNKG